MKYSTEVESEKRNKSPRNDLLRKRKCVGIIQAAKAHTGTFCFFPTTTDQPRCVQMPEPASPWTVWAKWVESSARSAAAADEQATRKSVYFRGRLQKTRMGTPAFSRDTWVPFLKRRCRFKFGVCPNGRENGQRRFRGIRGPGGLNARPSFRFHRWCFFHSSFSAACLPNPMNGAVSPQREKKSNTSSGR